MSLDSIVTISISTQSLQMAQAGFGVPLVIDPEHDGWAEWMGRMLPLPPGSASWAFKQLEGVNKGKLNTGFGMKGAQCF